MIRTVRNKKNTCCTSKSNQHATLQIKSAEINGYRPYVVHPGNSCYTGYWKHNKQNGFGARHNFTGLIYDGQWKNGMRHGQGSLRKQIPNKTYQRTYVGQWRNDQKCGEGKQFYKNGVYYGWWNVNKRCGPGMMIYDDGSQYIGEWMNDSWHGAGVLFQANRNRYEGFFTNGKKHGEGLFYHMQTGQIQKGVWHENICKTSMMFDHFRNHALCPTPYPIQRCGLDNPDGLIHDLFREYLPQTKDTDDHLVRPFCMEVARTVKRHLQEFPQLGEEPDCGPTTMMSF